MSYVIGLAPNPTRSTGSEYTNYTHAFARWQHSIRDWGGCWEADGTIPVNDTGYGYGLDPAALDNLFLNGLGKRIIVSDGGRDWWEGQIVRLEYRHRGQVFTRSLETVANWVKVLYSKVGPNLLTNGDVEGGAWTAVGTPSTHATDTTWWARGTTSMHVVTDSASEGTQPHAAATVAIAASQAYDCSVIVYVVSGTWTLQVDDGSGNVIAQRSTTSTGRTWLQCSIPDSNTYTTARVRLLSSAGAEEVYADGAMLRTAAERSETEWVVNTGSVSDNGRIERVILERERTDTEADGIAQRELAEKAWPRTAPPLRGETFAPRRAPADQLTVSCLGLGWMLSWRHALTDGAVAASTHVASLLDESQFIASSSALVDTNSTSVTLNSRNPVPLWSEIEDIIQAGDSSGNYWTGGTYPGFQFRYQQRRTGTQYRFQNGRMQYYGGGEIPPLEFEPGWCLMADMPTDPSSSGSDDDDPRRVWLYETWFVVDRGQVQLKWSRRDE